VLESDDGAGDRLLASRNQSIAMLGPGVPATKMGAISSVTFHSGSRNLGSVEVSFAAGIIVQKLFVGSSKRLQSWVLLSLDALNFSLSCRKHSIWCSTSWRRSSFLRLLQRRQVSQRWREGATSDFRQGLGMTRCMWSSVNPPWHQTRDYKGLQPAASIMFEDHSLTLCLTE